MNLVIVETIKQKFGNRIVSLVGYGSYFFDRSHLDSDIDLCILLDSRNAEDLLNLNQIIKQQNQDKIDITVHYLDETEQRGWENFQHGTHGVFFLSHLASSKLLLGYDIFARKAVQIPVSTYKKSLVFQINQYIDRIQVEIINNNEPESFYKKYLTRIMTDMMLLESEISYREVNRFSAMEISNTFIQNTYIFSIKTKDAYKAIMQDKTSKKEISVTLGLIVKDFQKQLSRVINT